MKTIMITGANRGLGLGFTQHYLDLGCKVFAAARKPYQCPELADLVRSHRDRLITLRLDVASSVSIATAAEELSGKELDILVNNAGASADESFGQWTAETFATMFAINATGPALVSQAFAPLLKPGGKLVNLSSGLASMGFNINPETGMDAYSASKAALNMVTRRLAPKLEPRGIVAVAIDPGWVRTRMGGENADLSVDESINDLVRTIDELDMKQSGLFLSRKGEALPW